MLVLDTLNITLYGDVVAGLPVSRGAERLNVHMIVAIVLRIEKKSTIASARQVAIYPQTWPTERRVEICNRLWQAGEFGV